MKIYKPFTFLILTFVFFNVKAQDDDLNLPTVIPPAPETAELFKYQEYPMDYSTGLPQISIPIYKVKSGSLSIPISLSYHADGCKVTDRDGPIAVGWSLNAGGMVSRTVHGSVDFGQGQNTYPFPYPFNINNINHLSDLDDLAYLQNIIHCGKDPDRTSPGQWLDAEYDVFSYEFGGNSGKFIFEDNDGVKTPVLLPHKPYKITPITTSVGLGAIEIIDEKGVYYYFQGYEKLDIFGGDYATTGYVLEEMISADKTDTISFVYSGSIQSRKSISQHFILNDQVEETSDSGTEGLKPLVETTNEAAYQISRLTEIHFNHGKVLFNLESGSHLVDNIQIINNDGQTIKTIDLNRSLLHSLSEMEYTTHKLDDIVFKDKNGLGIETYSFEYYPTKYSGVNDGNGTQLNVRYKDWWGYYNASGEHDMIPQQTVTFYSDGNSSNLNLGNSNADREPDIEALKSGVLKKIAYPTGGSTEFTYENNKYKDLATNQITLGPGLRVSQIETTDEIGNVITKTIKYGVNESGYGFIDMEPGLDKMNNQFLYRLYTPNSNPQFAGRNYRQRIFYSGFVSQLSELSQRPIIYTEVTEYIGTTGSNIGKTIYEYDRVPWSAAGMGPQKWHIYNFNYWNNSELTKQTDYKYINSTTYQKVKETDYNYVTNTTEYIKGLHVQRRRVLPQTERVFHTGLYPETHTVQEDNLQIYVHNEYRFPVGTKNLTSVTETLFDENETEIISSSTSYTYNSEQLVSEISKNTSDGESIDTEIKYPFDYSGDLTLTQMTSPSVNMMDYTVEKKEFKNSQHVKSIKTNYNDWGGANPMIAPETVEAKFGNNSYETRIRYHSYDDDGNPTTVSKENDVIFSYIWSYGRILPIAKVDNASYTQIESAVSNLGASFLANLENSRDKTFINNSLASLRNEINNDLPEAFITTYVHEPLVGMTSQTDPSGISTGYDYDSYNRLEAVKDNNGNIVKAQDYNYKPLPNLSLSSYQLSFSDESESKSVSIYSNVSWVVSDNQSWITTSPSSGSGDGTISIDVTANGSSSSRNGVVTISENDGSGVQDREILISQDEYEPTLEVSPTSLDFFGEQTRSLTITSDIGWNIAVNYFDDSGWLDISSTSGSGNATINVTSSDESTGGGTWNAEIRVYGGGKESIINCAKHF